MNNFLNMDFSQEELNQAQKDEFALIPAGIYTAQVVRSEVKTTKAGTGQYLSIGVQIIDGQYAGRIVFSNINFSNPNETAQSIGRRQLAQLTAACGKTRVGDSAELHEIPMQIKLGIQKGRDGYDDSNDIKNFAFLAGGASAKPNFGAQPQAVAQTPVQDTRPAWQRG